MARRLLRRVATIAASLVLTAATLAGIAVWRRSEDRTWCGKATAAAVPALRAQERSACLEQRRRQRAFFGTVWRTGGTATAACGFDFARYQMLSEQDPASAAALLSPYGFDGSAFDASDRSDQNRFLRACLSTGRHPAG